MRSPAATAAPGRRSAPSRRGATGSGTDEIRRRSGDQSRPELELDYLRRLLERF